MKKLAMVVAVVTLAAACAKESASLEIKPGNTVSIEKKDGVVVVGRLVEVKPEHVVVDTSAGRKEIARVDISTFRADATAVSTGTARPARLWRPSDPSRCRGEASSVRRRAAEYREGDPPWDRSAG